MNNLFSEAEPQRLGLVSLDPFSDEKIAVLTTIFSGSVDQVHVSHTEHQGLHGLSLTGIGERVPIEPLRSVIPDQCAVASLSGDIARHGPALVVSDVDSSFIQQEVIELLARRAGREAEVRAITESAMRGEIDFTESLKQRVATLAGLQATIIADVRADITLSPGARTLVTYCRSRNVQLGLISGGFNQVLGPLAGAEGIDLYQAIDLEIIDDTLTGRTIGRVVDATEKRNILESWALHFDVPLSRVACIGDGANDLEMMSVAGHSIGYCAKPIVAQRADTYVPFARFDAAALLWGWA